MAFFTAAILVGDSFVFLIPERCVGAQAQVDRMCEGCVGVPVKVGRRREGCVGALV